jgi:DNA-binding MarR family transcriptional regulator
MNAIFFGLKRAFHGTLRIARRKLKALGLTSARFDLLYALTDDVREDVNGIYQSDLRRVLGVTRPTVSRMLISLEALGLVVRRRCELDRRQVEVALTRRGRKVFRTAYRLLVRGGWAQRAVDAALRVSRVGPQGEPQEVHDDWHCLCEMAALDAQLTRLRRAYGDFATLDYPWSPDE